MSDSDSDNFEDAQEHFQDIPESHHRNDKDLKRIRKDCHEVLANLDSSFCSDLALHLYMIRMLASRDYFVANGRFSSWPLPKNQVPVPVASREYVDECNIHGDAQKRHIVPYGEICNENKERPTEQLLEYVPPATDAKEELGLQLRAIFQQKIYNKVHAYNLSNAAARIRDKNAPTVKYLPVLDPPVDLPQEAKAELFTKINNVFDKLIEQRKACVRADSTTALNWLSVAQQAKDHDAMVCRAGTS
ncbi:hypothetical protein KL911_000489 [Ogataea haglerorum]|uniref:uncharacterized protein n=1 Tax=Ogataea haglerorum TaxID=1937702 RepID=UPI001C89E6D6|nr:uncharacterized protein KL911_000489 [Ogataea haglerorum]KAG7759352.1 hypothetical protein KL911_000489 [Ogataea haglerorum]